MKFQTSSLDDGDFFICLLLLDPVELVAALEALVVDLELLGQVLRQHIFRT